MTEAEDLLRQATILEPNTPDSFCMLAKLSDAKKQEEKALTAWRKCLDLANQNPIVLETQPEINQWAALAHERLETKKNK